MSYDNDTNRELAKTALAIYAKHSVPQNGGRSNCAVSSLNENVNYNSVPQRTPQTLKEAISNVLLEYSSDVVLLSEQSIGRKLNSNEINNVAGRLLEYINILPPKQQVSLMEELAALYEETPPPVENFTADSGNYSTAANPYLDPYNPYQYTGLAAGGNNVYNTSDGRNRRPLARQNQLSAGNPTNTGQYGYPISMDDGLRPGKAQPGFGAGRPTNTAATNQAQTGGPQTDGGMGQGVPTRANTENRRKRRG
jgi:hypothetical protein